MDVSILPINLLQFFQIQNPRFWQVLTPLAALQIFNFQLHRDNIPMNGFMAMEHPNLQAQQFQIPIIILEIPIQPILYS